jgi:hypothetical protein
MQRLTVLVSLVFSLLPLRLNAIDSNPTGIVAAINLPTNEVAIEFPPEVAIQVGAKVAVQYTQGDKPDYFSRGFICVMAVKETPRTSPILAKTKKEVVIADLGGCEEKAKIAAGMPAILSTQSASEGDRQEPLQVTRPEITPPTEVEDEEVTGINQFNSYIGAGIGVSLPTETGSESSSSYGVGAGWRVAKNRNGKGFIGLTVSRASDSLVASGVLFEASTTAIGLDYFTRTNDGWIYGANISMGLSDLKASAGGVSANMSGIGFSVGPRLGLEILLGGGVSLSGLTGVYYSLPYTLSGDLGTIELEGSFGFFFSPALKLNF